MNGTPPLAARIGRGDVLYGVIIKMPSPALTELVGHTGFDLVVIDTEHGVSDNTELEHHLRAADSAGVSALVRVGVNDPLLTLRALDAGAAGVIVPHVNDADQARTAVEGAHYPPVGIRSLAVSTRAGHHGTVPLHQHLADASANTIVVAQAEDQHSAINSASIAATRGVNAVWIGPNDLALSLGYPGQMDHPDVIAAIDQIAANVIASTNCALCVLVDTTEQATRWQQRGARIILFNASAILAKELAEILVNVHSDLPDTEPVTVDP